MREIFRSRHNSSVTIITIGSEAGVKAQSDFISAERTD